MEKIIVSSKESSQRIDVFLSQHPGFYDYQQKNQPRFSRVRIQQLIRSQNVLVNGQAVAASYKVRAGDKITYSIPPLVDSSLMPQNLPLEIIYEDSDIIVINKPKGIVVHPAAGITDGTLVNALLHHVKDLAGVGGEKRPGIVHRLDKDTSGVMVVAKNDFAHHSLTRQFKDRTVKKTYWALVHGAPRLSAGKIETLFGRHPGNRKKMAVLGSLAPREQLPKQKIAITTYKILKTIGAYSLLEIKIETGRTHQIRVHLNYLGCPVVGDPVYGKRANDLGATAQLLHAKKIAFLHPRSGKPVGFEAPLTVEFEKALGAGRFFGKSVAKVS